MKRSIAIIVVLFSVAAVATAQSVLFRSDGRLAAGDRVSYQLSVEEGSNVTVRVASVDFQPVIEITTGQRRVSSQGNQGGAVASARVRDGEALSVAVSSVTPEGTGHFIIRVDRLEPSQPRELPLTIEGTLESFDMIYADRGGFVDWYPIILSGEEGRVGLSVSSFEFDTYLVARLPDGRELSNDDASGSDSLITFEAVEGVVEVGVTSYSGESTGSYTFAARPLEGPEPISVGDRVRGTLRAGELPLATYVLTGEEGEAVEISLSSSDFDTVLEVLGPDGRSMRNDDDSTGMGTDSRMVYIFASEGEAEITVSSFGSGSGDYVLEVSRDSRLEDYQELPSRTRLRSGEEVTQLLGPGDTQEMGGSFSQLFTVEAQRGDLIEIVLRSQDFDAYLEVLGPDGSTYADDDSAGGTDSRVSFGAPSTGVYEVRVGSFFSSGSGLFTLTFNREAPAGSRGESSGGAMDLPGGTRPGGRSGTTGGAMDMPGGNSPGGNGGTSGGAMDLPGGNSPGGSRGESSGGAMDVPGGNSPGGSRGESSGGAMDVPGGTGEVVARFRGNLNAGQGEPRNTHLLQARQGDRITLVASSRSFVPRIELRSPSGHTVASAEGSGSQATLRVTIPEDGEYTVVCSSRDRSARGGYELRVLAP